MRDVARTPIIDSAISSTRAAFSAGISNSTQELHMQAESRVAVITGGAGGIGAARAQDVRQALEAMSERHPFI